MMRFNFVFLLLFVGCASSPQLDEPKVVETFRHDLDVTINGKAYVGFGVLPPAASYTITVVPEGKIDRIIWRTCAREFVEDKPNTGWFNKKFTFTHIPAPGLEDSTACSGLWITVLEEKKRRNGFAFFDIEDSRPEVDLGASIVCNGSLIKKTGVGVCAAAAGLISEIKFNQAVIQQGSVGVCDVMRPLNGNEAHYRFILPSGYCTFYFVSNEKAKNGKRYIYRFTTIGHTDVPAR